MTIIRCKMCGGELEIRNNESVAECEYCGSKQTLSKLEDERLQNMYDRANHFRRNNEFDKAEVIYENILNEDPTDAELYWSLVLCRYGIEYVEDPTYHKRVPTVNRTQFTSIFDDDNYKSALQYADASQKSIYAEEASAINEIQKGILAISQQEEPFDVFICYKETDKNGRRTPDSVLANDLYHQLIQEGFRVFFARITLEDKLGSAYEPYIFAALNSAKVMVVLGTKPEYFKAVWVRNEWSRFLSLIKQGQKKTLIPAYKDMDPYELPDEFSHLQAQDMSKLGFMQDLIRGIKKITQVDEPKSAVKKETVISSGSTNIAAFLRRAFIFLEDREWNSAEEYCEKVLDIEPENAEAYLGKLMAELCAEKQSDLRDEKVPFDSNKNYQKAIRFADEKLKTTLTGYIDYIKTRNENTQKESIYNHAKSIMSTASGGSAYKEAAKLFDSIAEYKDAAILANDCKAEVKKREEEKTLCNELLNEYISAVQREKGDRNKKLQASKQVNDLTKKLPKLIRIKEVWEEIEKNIESYNKEISLVQETISKLKKERHDLGLFAGKKKKGLEIELKCLNEKICSIRQKISDEESKKEGFFSLDLLNNEIQQTMTNIEVQNRILEEISKAMNANNLREELSKYAHGKMLLSRYDKIGIKKVGDYIKFGSYIQRDNKKLDIEWLVLEVKGSKMFVISKYALDCQPYHDYNEEVTWEKCSLREWLNDEFIDEAFSVDERLMIPKTTVPADKNPKYDTDQGNDTEDQIFLLSMKEANCYFCSDREQLCKITEYAVNNGAHNYGDFDCCWWLRSNGYRQNNAVYVSGVSGCIYEPGGDVDTAIYAVRPALWIDLTS